MKLKEEIINLLEKDKEFRYAIAGLLGLEEILRRLDKHEEELVKLRKEQIKLRKDMNKGFRRHDEELARLREDMNKGFERHDKEIAKLREDMVTGFKRHDEEIAKLREDMIAGFKRHDEEIAKLREDMVTGFKRHDEEIAKLREDMKEGFMRYDEELTKLREDMNKGFMLVERHISALGARWGLISEEAFREGIKGLIKKEFGFEVERWIKYDQKGSILGYPSQVEIDLALHDEKTILLEIKSHVRASDVYIFKRKAEFYEEIEKKKPSRLLLITPYAEDKAIEAAKNLGIEIYTKI